MNLNYKRKVLRRHALAGRSTVRTSNVVRVFIVHLRFAWVAALFVLVLGVDPSAGQEPPIDRVGDVYETAIRLQTKSTRTSGSGSSSSGSVLRERVIAIRDGGVELEFDLSKDTEPKHRARYWQYPVRVFKPRSGPFELLNEPELQERLQAWLETDERIKALCDRWVFTWTAQRIDCNPQSVLRHLERFDLRPADFREGGLYQDAHALAPQPLRSTGSELGGSALLVDLVIDPEVVRRERAELDIAVAQMTRREPPSLKEALEARSGERISGTISITFELDGEGRIVRRTKVTETSITTSGGGLEQQVNTETTRRHRLEE